MFINKVEPLRDVLEILILLLISKLSLENIFIWENWVKLVIQQHEF